MSLSVGDLLLSRFHRFNLDFKLFMQALIFLLVDFFAAVLALLSYLLVFFYVPQVFIDFLEIGIQLDCKGSFGLEKMLWEVNQFNKILGKLLTLR